ncbi:MAG: hypothetical protein KatS3mg104_2302 [Phycisphaerae bacterium]|jgi:chemotaxis protein CheX|nr:MAG: hypothetical protein KatS3mg104_2302 [Phycisphaerae bacterium]
MSSAAATRQPIDPKLIIPFVNSVRQVFSTMVGVPVTIDRPSIKSSPGSMYDVSSIIGFSGEVVGAVVVSYQRETALKLVESFAGSRFDLLSPDFADAIGELANMIAGSAKKDLGVNASITIPNVVVGPSHSIARLKDVPCLVVPCKTPVGDFAVEISIKPMQKQA